MDSFLQKFSLQNLLRQFFCGVVFFMPILLFAGNARKKWEQLFESEYTDSLFFVVLAYLVGTIIYHLEKNLHSYPLQLVYEYYYGMGKNRWVRALLLLLVFMPIICFILVVFDDFWMFMLILALVCYIILAFCLLRTGKRRVVSQVMHMWYLEEIAQLPQRVDTETVKSAELSELLARNVAAKRISTWSDFVHCVQSCCFAWILGCCFVRLVCRFGTITPADNLDLFLMLLSAECAAVLLLVEMIIDMHRYRFVLAASNRSRNIEALKASNQVHSITSKKICFFQSLICGLICVFLSKIMSDIKKSTKNQANKVTESKDRNTHHH